MFEIASASFIEMLWKPPRSDGSINHAIKCYHGRDLGFRYILQVATYLIHKDLRAKSRCDTNEESLSNEAQALPQDVHLNRSA